MFASDKLIKTKTAFLERSMSRFRKLLPVVLALIALAAVAISLTNCGTSQAQARFVQGVAGYSGGNGELDIWVNGTRYYSQASFDSILPATGYAGVPAGSDTFIAYPAGTSTGEIYTTANVNLNSGTSYTVVASGATTETGKVFAFPDDNTEPANGFIYFRVIDASPTAPGTIYVYLQALPVVSNGCTGGVAEFTLSNGQASSYTTQNSGVPYNANGGFELFICNAENGNPLQNSTNGLTSVGGSNFGSIRTIVITDSQSGGFDPGGIVVLKDLN
jgi:hypothetical protein